MTLQGVEELIGPFHDRMHDSKPRRRRPRLYFWDDVEVVICHGLVVDIGLPLWRESVTLPDGLRGQEDMPMPSHLPLSEVLDALDAAGCAWKDAPELVLGDRARGVRTLTHGVCLVFGPEGCDTSALRLHKIYKPDPGPTSPVARDWRVQANGSDAVQGHPPGSNHRGTPRQADPECRTARPKRRTMGR